MRVTKAQLELLQAVADGAVYRHYPIGMVPSLDDLDRGPGCRPRRSTVTARVAKLADAGLVQLQPADNPRTFKASRRWDVTPAGRQLLDAIRVEP